jgi:uncharacterized DUF497 family protein
MKFDWDAEKSTSNLEKYGMDFNSARRLESFA